MHPAYATHPGDDHVCDQGPALPESLDYYNQLMNDVAMMSMPDDRKVLANRENAKKSTGPRTAEGKDKARTNAYKHGLTSTVVGPERERAEVERKLPLYQERYRAADEVMRDRTRFAAMHVVRAQAAYEHGLETRRAYAKRALFNWVDDRRDAVAKRATRIAEDPSGVVAELRGSYHGRLWMIGAWCRFARGLEQAPPSQATRQQALTLLGTPRGERDGVCEVDLAAWPGAKSDTEIYRRVAAREIELLGSRLDEFEELDEIERERAVSGSMAIDHKDLRLALRYERESRRAADRAFDALDLDLWERRDGSASAPVNAAPQPSRPDKTSAQTAEVLNLQKVKDELAEQLHDVEMKAYLHFFPEGCDDRPTFEEFSEFHEARRLAEAAEVSRQDAAVAVGVVADDVQNDLDDDGRLDDVSDARDGDDICVHGIPDDRTWVVTAGGVASVPAVPEGGVGASGPVAAEGVPGRYVGTFERLRVALDPALTGLPIALQYRDALTPAEIDRLLQLNEHEGLENLTFAVEMHRRAADPLSTDPESDKAVALYARLIAEVQATLRARVEAAERADASRPIRLAQNAQYSQKRRNSSENGSAVGSFR